MLWPACQDLPGGPTYQPAWTVALAHLALTAYPTEAEATSAPAPRRSSSSPRAPAPAPPSLVTLPVKVEATGTPWWLSSGNGQSLWLSSTHQKGYFSVIQEKPQPPVSPRSSPLCQLTPPPECPQKGLSLRQALALAPPRPGSSSDPYKWRPQQARKKASAHPCTSRSCLKALATCRPPTESPTGD